MSSKPAIPGYALALAPALRLADLHASLQETSAPAIVAPRAAPEAAQRLHLTYLLLTALNTRSIEGISGYVDLPSVLLDLRRSNPDLEEEDLRFVCRFLDVDSECAYVDPEDGQTKGTRSWTRLVNFDLRRERVRITEAGRLFVKLSNTSHSWLYEDKQAAKLVSAIRMAMFGDIPGLVTEHVGSLRRITEELTRYSEAPGFDQIAASYFANREAINEMLSTTFRHIGAALQLLETRDVQERLRIFLELNPTSLVSLQALRGSLRLAHEAMESANRAWARFLGLLQDGKRQYVGVIDFQQAIRRFVDNPPSDKDLEKFLGGLIGWIVTPHFLSVADLDQVIEYEVPRGPIEPVVFEENPDELFADDLEFWLGRNAQVLLQTLQLGPVRLADLVQQPDLTPLELSTVENVASLFSVFTVEMPLGTTVRLALSIGDLLPQQSPDGRAYSISDLTLSLYEEKLGT